MKSSSTAPVPSPIKPGNDSPAVIQVLAEQVFAARAKRFEQLAKDHPMGDYLLLLARLSEIQHELLQAHPAVELPDSTAREKAQRYGMPVLATSTWRRDPVWQQHLAAIVRGLQEHAPAALRSLLEELLAADAETLEELASNVLNSNFDPDHSARLPFIAAALQVYWTWMASQPELAQLRRLDVGSVCPCCGSLPVSSTIEPEPHAGTRYLHCSLCNTAWNMVRVNCSSCGNTDQVSYRLLEDEEGKTVELVRSETCDHCHSYLKQVRRDKNAFADPVADDLATLALDILTDEAGYLRSGPNLFFIPGRSAA